ncbi:MAG: hypothetical protein J0I71_10195 [Rhodanobacter sp.]|nr:hypothetical protein [Rhodanobacter sp.]
MNRVQLAVLVLCLSPACIVVASSTAPAPITSRAALARYLHDTQPGTSPLDDLSPGGRKRFLAQLDFGPHGLRGMSLEDPANELTRPQIVQLLALFGAQSHAVDGLTPAEQSRRNHERAQDAASRGCAVDTCGESMLERHYDEFVLQETIPSPSPAERSTWVERRYDRLFGDAQAPERLRLASHTDLRLLKRAAEAVVFHAPSPTHIAQLRMDLAEMHRRGMASDKDYARLHQALITGRDFDAANTLARHHPEMGIPVIPTFRRAASPPPGQPTALTVDARTGTMARQSFDLSAPLRIVVVASCHFSRDAARAIRADAQLRSLFAGNAIWLASQNEQLDAVSDWNREFPDQPIHIAWHDSEWSMLDSWAMPTFYLFRHGQLVTKFSGWKDVDTLKQSLREGGVLQ